VARLPWGPWSEPFTILDAEASAPYVVPRWSRFDSSTRELHLTAIASGAQLYRTTISWT
jgi:hypothetical protein